MNRFHPSETIERTRKRWDVYLFVDGNNPVLIESKVNTKVAKLLIVSWDYKNHDAALIFWPNELQVPAPWFTSKATFCVWVWDDWRYQKMDCEPVTPLQASTMLSISSKVLLFLPVGVQPPTVLNQQ